MNTPTLAISSIDGERIATRVPAGAVVTVLNSDDIGCFVDVLWDDRTVSMFTADLRERGEVISAADG